MIEDSKRKTIVVLGMHRSATSLISGCINNNISMGDEFIKADKHNINGYYEDKEMLEMNEEILKVAEGSWDNPPSRGNIIFAAGVLKSKMRRMVSDRNKKYNIWGWKDPRNSITIPAWHSIISNPIYVVCYRSSEEVVESIMKIHNFPRSRCLKLYREYNDAIFSFMKDFTSGNI